MEVDRAQNSLILNNGTKMPIIELGTWQKRNFEKKEGDRAQNSLILSNGTKMPIIGLGTWQGEKGEVEKAVKTALDIGYRSIDTAESYNNETEIGNALKEYFLKNSLKREDVFITTKLAVTHTREDQVEPSLKGSLKRLQLDYVDLYLVHMPGAFNEDMSEQDKTIKIEDTWKGMEKVYDKGLAKAIGVSNFNAEQVERIQKGARVPIHNNQVELHLHFAQHELHEVCKRLNITMTAYAPIGSPGRSNFRMPNGGELTWPSGLEPLKNEKVLGIAKKYGKTPAQILLRHLIQRCIAVIPKSVNPERVRENFQVFDFSLSDEDVKQLDAAPQGTRLFLQEFLAGHPEDPFKQDRK